jgi:DUF1680 family protein
MCFFEEDNTNYGCCVAISPAGVGVLLESAFMAKDEGCVFNHYVDGVFNADGAELAVSTKYPYDLSVKLTVNKFEGGEKTLSFRIPSWSKNTSVSVCGKQVSVDGAYVNITREWKSGDTVEICFDDGVYAYLPPYADGPDADKCVAFYRGPVMLASDARIGDAVDTPASVAWDSDMSVSASVVEPTEAIPDARLTVRLATKTGGEITLVDYGSAGKTQDERSKCAVWLLK